MIMKKLLMRLETWIHAYAYGEKKNKIKPAVHRHSPLEEQSSVCLRLSDIHLSFYDQLTKQSTDAWELLWEA